VSEKVLTSEGVEEFIASYVRLINQMVPGYIREGKKFVTLAVGCTGGKHRSVAVAQELATRLCATVGSIPIDAKAVHRDMGRE
ncbi:MAG: RNase adaptor protein RapZ, partial [Actinobacteria bacterium]|nr:RNase adaptor protein RapZ [Actinomycetota bacterium]